MLHGLFFSHTVEEKCSYNYPLRITRNNEQKKNSWPIHYYCRNCSCLLLSSNIGIDNDCCYDPNWVNFRSDFYLDSSGLIDPNSPMVF